MGTEILRQLSWADTGASTWHFRDRGGAEVDFILEHPGGRIVGIKVQGRPPS